METSIPLAMRARERVTQGIAVSIQRLAFLQPVCPFPRIVLLFK